MATMNAVIIDFECPGSSACKAPRTTATGSRSHALAVPDWISAGISGTDASQVFCERLELAKCCPSSLLAVGHALVETMLHVVVDQLALGIADRVLHRVKLLRKLETGARGLDHANKRAQMSLGTLEANYDIGMTAVLHFHILSTGIAWMQSE